MPDDINIHLDITTVGDDLQFGISNDESEPINCSCTFIGGVLNGSGTEVKSEVCDS